MQRPLVKRKKAIDATKAKFEGKPFAWGSVDCVKLCAFHLRRLGHKVKLSGSGNYRSAAAATKALENMGFATLADAVDAQGLERIPPAMRLLGDLVLLPGDHELGGLCIHAGGDKLLGFHEDTAYLAHLTPSREALFDAIAWRAL